jgi:D-inositol-3-phosphate glycosyltransferase
MKRIAQLSYHTSPVAALGGRVSGGMNVYVLELSRELARQGHHVDIFTRREGDGPAVEILEPGLRLVQIEAGPVEPVEKEDLPAHLGDFIRNLLRFVAGEPRPYDVVHSHYWQSARAGIHVARALGAPHVTMFHTLGEVKNRARITEEEPRRRILHERNAARRADAIITASDHERAVLRRYYGADESRMDTIPCGIDLELFYPRDRDAARVRLCINPGAPVLLWVGRLEKLKGVDILIQALAEVETPGTQLIIVGGDAQATGLREELSAQAEDAGVRDRVRFEGAVPHDALPDYYAAADVCVVPSYYESFGLVAVESMACGTPVVASRVGGLVSTVIDGVNGYLIPWRCPGPFAEKLDVLLNNPHLRHNFSRAGRRNVERFRWRNIAMALSSVYERVETRKSRDANEAAFDALSNEALESALLAE